MRSFSSTELANKTGDVLAAAAAGPVAINRHGKPRFVMLSAEEYDRIAGQHSSARTFHVADLTDAEASNLINALQSSIDND